MRRTIPAVLMLLAFAACTNDNGGNQPRQRPAFPVEVETIEGRTVQYVVDAVGSVEAFEEVLVTARVAGVIEAIHFREGDLVDSDTVLVEIQPDRFKHALDAAEAQHARAKAESADAQAGLRRRETSERAGGSIFSPEEIELWRTRVAVAEANEREKAAELEQARLNMRHARPKAPIEGIVEIRPVSTGQYVQPGTLITRLLRRDPMLLRFAVSEREATQLRSGQEARFTVRGGEALHIARIIHVASEADRASRMVDVVAEIDSEAAEGLTPNAFARVQVRVGERTNAPTVPETAIRPSERGFLVFVISDGTAHMRVIELGLRTPDGRVEVLSGLESGEVLVVRGSEALRDGAQVRITNDAADGPNLPDARS
jgi:membrane fusion protein, multidrug efflux system